jgi:hypothetical protein
VDHPQLTTDYELLTTDYAHPFMNPLNFPKRVGQLLIVAYQHTLSPDHGFMSRFFTYRVCRYHPTCSEYSYDALGKYGLIRGSWMTGKRLLRCTPWHPGGHDPVP